MSGWIVSLRAARNAPPRLNRDGCADAGAQYDATTSAMDGGSSGVSLRV